MYYIDFWSSYFKNLAELTSSPAAPETATASTITTLPATEISCTATAQAAQYKPQMSPDDKYAYLTEYGTQILMLFAADGSCNYVSRNFESITGHNKDAAAGHAFYTLLTPDLRDRIQELIRLQHSNPTPQIIRARLVHSNQKHQWYMFMLHPKKQGNQMEIVCVAENIHENILTQNTLQKARMEAELALRSRSEFLANMSHDLRTPLNAVLGFAQMITGEIIGKIDNPQYMDYARHIQESGYDLLGKIEDLLEIANLDAGHVTLDKGIARVGEILKQVLDAQAHHAQGKRIRLVCDATNNHIELLVDKLKIQHIIGHLVSNAIKHCKAGNQINIRTSKMQNGGFRLRVTDNGCGIDELQLAQIRKALQQKSCWTSKHSQGIGLGLALTKEFVELHGGELYLESSPDSGATVDIMLPRDCVISSPAKMDYIRELA